MNKFELMIVDSESRGIDSGIYMCYNQGNGFTVALDPFYKGELVGANITDHSSFSSIIGANVPLLYTKYYWLSGIKTYPASKAMGVLYGISDNNGVEK